jgi:hypothetical protein
VVAFAKTCTNEINRHGHFSLTTTGDLAEGGANDGTKPDQVLLKVAK